MAKLNEQEPRKAGVVVHLFFKASQWHVAYMRRPNYLGVHSGQISFPGGAVEPSDRDLWQTARREAYEEVGLELAPSSWKQPLSELYIPPSNFLVAPWVTVSDAEPTWRLEEKEVAEVFSIPLESLLDGTLISSMKVTSEMGKYSVPCYRWGAHNIWGATAMITAELVSILAAD